MDASYALTMTLGLLFYSVILVGIHLLCVFGPYRMAKHAGVPHAWLGLLPIGKGWLLGLLGERALYTRTGRRSRMALWLPALQGMTLCALAMVFGLALMDSDFNSWVLCSLVLLLVSGVAGVVLFYYALYNVFSDYAPDNAVLYTVLSIIFQIYFVFLLIEMNTVPVSVTGPGAFQYGRPKYDRNHQWYLTPPGYGCPPGYGPYPPPQGGPSGGPGYPYPPAPGQQGPYTTNPGQPPYPGQDPRFYQGSSGYYQPQPPAQPFDPSRNFPAGGYDPKHPEDFPPPERPRDDRPGGGPEL